MKNKFEKLKMPTHIAFIMDGNRRWARRRGMPATLGHRQGALNLKSIIQQLEEMEGIKYASFFAFSTENWNRQQQEIDYIFDLAYKMVVENEQSFINKNIKVVVMGDTSRFSEKLQEVIKRVIKETENNTGLVVFLGLNYGGRDDIVHACNKLISQGKKEVSIEDIKQNLYSAPASDIDLLVRTSGEMRISNFMLFQLAYSELYFTKTCWPAFDKKQLFKALKEYTKRNRTFGGK